MHAKVKKMQKYLLMSQKCCTFARFFGINPPCEGHKID